MRGALAELDAEFEAMYAPIGRPSIPAREAAAEFIAAGLLHDPLGAAADGKA